MAMTDEEFERLKEAEKEHLRTKKRLQARLRALKKQQRTESLVTKMKEGAQRLLRETEALVDAIQGRVAQSEGRVDAVVDEAGAESDLAEADAEIREERAESLVQQYKASSGRVSTRDRGSASSGSEDPEDLSAASRAKGPEKTIGRMDPSGPAGSDEAEE